LALALHETDYNYTEIGRALGVTRQQAFSMCKRAREDRA
jgi:hypothetical protein